jgi:hypothetical protein
MSAANNEWYEIIKQVVSPGTKQIVTTVRGLAYAEMVVQRLDNELSPEEQAEGWGHYLRRGQRPLGPQVRRRTGGPSRRSKR